jgi:hypothetical protein
MGHEMPHDHAAHAGMPVADAMPAAAAMDMGHECARRPAARRRRRLCRRSF